MLQAVLVSGSSGAKIPGWFSRIDMMLFRFFLNSVGEPGDLAEMGVYLGKSAVLMGEYLHPSETFTVVDLFEAGGTRTDGSNAAENRASYPDLTRRAFEANYLGVHGELPVVIQGPSAEILDRARHGCHRFVHIDASHLYEHVQGDIASARQLLRSDGIVVLDDFRSEHTPGVAAAAWQAVGAGLLPIMLSPNKLYATWGDPTRWRTELDEWLRGSGLSHETQQVCGHDLVRTWLPKRRVERWVPPVAIKPVVAMSQFLNARLTSLRSR